SHHSSFFSFPTPPTTAISPLSLHDALPISRRIRESGVYCEIWPYHTPAAKIQAVRPCGLILSGGPSSVYDKDAPQLPPGLLDNLDRKSTRLNSSHSQISYAVFCLKKKNKHT